MKEGRDFIRDCLVGTPGSQAGTCDRSSEEDNGNAKDRTSSSSAPAEEPALSLRNLCFRFTEGGEDLIHGLDLDVGRGDFFCLLGGNLLRAQGMRIESLAKIASMSDDSLEFCR